MCVVCPALSVWVGCSYTCHWVVYFDLCSSLSTRNFKLPRLLKLPHRMQLFFFFFFLLSYSLVHFILFVRIIYYAAADFAYNVDYSAK